MPKKTNAAPAEPTENLGSEETQDEVAYNESVAEPPAKAAPKKRASRSKTPEQKAAAREAHAERFKEDPPTEPTEEDNSDWSRPEYADDPGDFEFGSLDGDDEYHRVMYYGPEGTGKTVNVARMTELGDGNLLIINAEGGVKQRPLRFHGVDIRRVRTYPKPGEQITFEGLERLYYRLAADLDKSPGCWVGVAWDSVTAIYQFLLDRVIEDEIAKQQAILKRAGRGRAGRSGNIVLRDRFDHDRDDFATMSNQFRLLLRKYRTLPCHFAVTALLRRDEEKIKTGTKTETKVTYGPAINPALQTDLLGYMDVVIRTHVEENDALGPVYWGRTTPTATERGKDRLGGLPVELADPDMSRVDAYLRDELIEEDDPRQKQLQREVVRIARRSLAAAAPVIPESVAPEQADDSEMGAPADDADEAQAAPSAKPPARRSGKRRTADEAAARAKAKAEDMPPAKRPGSATNRAKARAAAAAPAKGDDDQPPF